MTGSVDLILVRHGNTFGPGDRVCWVGRGEDLPLVDRGREQAVELHGALEAAGWSPTAAVSGELVRQTEHLSLATGGRPEPTRDPRLDEVDYGAWGGLTTEEIEARFGAASVAAWNERSEVPEGAGWPEGRAELEGRVRAFATEIAEGAMGPRVLACSSNGLLRWFLTLVPGALEDAIARDAHKVRTGHRCRLVFDPGSRDWTVLEWNRAPSEPLARRG